MISFPSLRGTATVSTALAVSLLIGGCVSPAQTDKVEPESQQTRSEPTPIAPEFEKPAFRALDEPIATTTCDELVSSIPGVVAQADDDAPRQATLVEGELDCRYALVLTSEQGDVAGRLWVSVAYAGGDAGSAITGFLCCNEGELVAGSDPPRRDSCNYNLCAASFTVDGFLVSVVSQVSAEPPPAVHHAAIVGSVEQVVRGFEPPALLAPVDPSAVLVESCEQTTLELRSAVGQALGGDRAAFPFFFGSGDEFWMWPWVKQRRGTTECAWSLDDPAQGSGSPMAMVTVIPGAGELLERPNSRFVDIDGTPEQSTYYFAIDNAIVKVYGVDRPTAEAIAEAHRR